MNYVFWCYERTYLVFLLQFSNFGISIHVSATRTESEKNVKTFIEKSAKERR